MVRLLFFLSIVLALSGCVGKTKLTVMGYTQHVSTFDWVEHRDNKIVGVEFEVSENGAIEFTDFTNSYGKPSFAINYNYRWRSHETQAVGLKCGYARGYNNNPATWGRFCLPVITGDFEAVSFDYHIVPGVVWILFLKIPL